MTTTFDGWPAEALAVLAEIAADNRAEQWMRLRDRHSAAVRGPTLALAAELEAEFGPVRVLRPHVSRRFRPSAPPLRGDAGGVAASAGGCGLAFLLSPSELVVTAGHWRFDRGQLLRYRAAVAGEPGAPATLPLAAALPAAPPPDLASPDLASPDPESPDPESPDPASPDPEAPDPASPDPASPGPESPGVTSPGVASPGVASPSLASPGLATLGLASLGLASLGLASLGLAAPRLTSPGRAEAADASQSPGSLRSVSAVCEGREALDPGADLAVVLERLAADGWIPDPDGELRGTPRGWRRDHPRIALARRRGLQVVRRWELGAWISTPEPLERIRAAWRAAGPLVEWLDTHVGAADADRPPPAREPSTSDAPP